MATRLYFTATASPYIPATIRGAWDATAGTVTGLLGPVPSGSAATIGIAEASSTNNWDVLLGRWTSYPLITNVTFTAGTNTWQSIVGLLESNVAANDTPHYHIFVTQGDSDNLRDSALVVDAVNTGAAEEMPDTSSKGQLYNNSATNALTNTVSAVKGDRIVVEIGYQAINTDSNSYTGTMNYGNIGPTDLADTATTVTTNSGWIEFSNNFSFGFTNNNFNFGSAYSTNAGIISVTEKIK